jgi:hypothetical protein
MVTTDHLSRLGSPVSRRDKWPLSVIGNEAIDLAAERPLPAVEVPPKPREIG